MATLLSLNYNKIQQQIKKADGFNSCGIDNETSNREREKVK